MNPSQYSTFNGTHTAHLSVGTNEQVRHVPTTLQHIQITSLTHTKKEKIMQPCVPAVMQLTMKMFL